MFGGSLKWPLSDPIAETTILRFGEGVDTVLCLEYKELFQLPTTSFCFTDPGGCYS